MNTQPSTASNRGVQGPFFKEINVDTWRPVLWWGLPSGGRLGEGFSWTRSSTYCIPSVKGFLIGEAPYGYCALYTYRPLCVDVRQTEMCEIMTSKADLATMLPEWSFYLATQDRRGRPSIDGIPWKIHAIKNLKAYMSAATAFLRER